MPKAPKPAYPSYTAYSHLPKEDFTSACKHDAPWLTGVIASLLSQPAGDAVPKHFEQMEHPSRGESSSECAVITATPSRDVPSWSAYNSCISNTQPLTRVAAAPLIPAPAHEWSTLLTTLLQAQAIFAHVVGEGKTVVSFDVGLYIPAKQLQMQRTDLRNIILRPGELHVVMACLRTVGTYIENSGIDLSVAKLTYIALQH